MNERPLRDRLGSPMLPETYGVDRVVAVPISAETLFWHWELSGPARAALDGREGGRLRLRLLPSAAAVGAVDLGEQRGSHGSGRAVVSPGRSYLVRLAWVGDSGGERTVAESDVVRVPWDRSDGAPEAVRQTGASIQSVAGPRGEPPWGGAA